MFKRRYDIRQFLFSQYLADGIRITICIILPTIIFSYFANLETGITISLGALCISICDAPGPLKHRKNAMLYGNCFIFLMALLTGLTNNYNFLFGILIAASTFFFSMFSVFGTRTVSIGTAALLILILRMTHKGDAFNSIEDSLLTLSGGLWYMLLALLLYKLTPYRPAQRSLGECIHETAKYLRLKSDLYDTHKNIEDEYRKLIIQQASVNEKQEQVRELLFKNQELLKEPTRNAKILVLTFVELVDLFEHIMATWYDYTSLRERFSGTGILR